MDTGLGSSLTTLALPAGRPRRILVEAGSLLIAAAGDIRLDFPVAVRGDAVLGRALTLRAEEVHRVDDGGWIELSADTEAAAVIVAPTVAWARFVHGGGDWLARWQKFFAGNSARQGG